MSRPKCPTRSPAPVEIQRDPLHKFFECSQNNMFDSSLWSFCGSISLLLRQQLIPNSRSVDVRWLSPGHARQAASCKKRYDCHADSVVILGRLGHVDLCIAWHTEIDQEMSQSKDQPSACLWLHLFLWTLQHPTLFISSCLSKTRRQVVGFGGFKLERYEIHWNSTSYPHLLHTRQKAWFKNHQESQDIFW